MDEERGIQQQDLDCSDRTDNHEVEEALQETPSFTSSVVQRWTATVPAARYLAEDSHDVDSISNDTVNSQASFERAAIAPLPTNFAMVNETTATVDVWTDTTQEETDASLAEAMYQQELAQMKTQYEVESYCEDAIAFVEDAIGDYQPSSLPTIAHSNVIGTAPLVESFAPCVNDTQEAFVIESAPINGNQPLPASVLQTDRTSEAIPQRRQRRTVTPDAIVEVEDENDEHHVSLPSAPLWRDSKPPARRTRGANSGSNNRMGSISENHAHEYAAVSQSALVVDIQEDVHPAEGHASAAEWIGSSTASEAPVQNGDLLCDSHALAMPGTFSDEDPSSKTTPAPPAPPPTNEEALPGAIYEPGSAEAIGFVIESPSVTAIYESDSALATGTVVSSPGNNMPTATTIGEPMTASEVDSNMLDSAEFTPEEYNDEYMLKQRVDSVARSVPQESFAEQSRDSSLEYLHSSDREYQQNIASTLEARSESTTRECSEPQSIRDHLNALANEGLQSVSNSLVRGTSTAIEHLFGDRSPSISHHRRSNSAGDLAINAVSPRTLLPWSVIRNPSTNLWIATLQTNQRALDSNNIDEASRSLRVFSMQTENQAICLARAWTPPRMLDFSENKQCHICAMKFAVLRRACTLILAIIAILASLFFGARPLPELWRVHLSRLRCSGKYDLHTFFAFFLIQTQWPAKMVPETYNTKKEFFVNVCKSCSWLCNSFRQALLEGKRDQAVALFSTGNVNLYTPFANVKGELFYPVHCAVLGNNLDLLRFLVDEHCCPIKSVCVNQSKGGRQSYTPIVTSRGRSLLGMAMDQENMGMIKYLIVDKSVDSTKEPDITREMMGNILCMALRGTCSVRQEAFQRVQYVELAVGRAGENKNGDALDEIGPPCPSSGQERTISQEAQDFGAVVVSSKHRNNLGGTEEECILCCDNPMDCVATPCGHQMCCISCSEQLDGRCPVCSASCTFMRIYKS